MGSVRNGGLTLGDADVDNLADAVRAVWRAAEGDSNDAEILAGHGLAEAVASLLGMDPDGEVPDRTEG
jgi:hypothetical protein